MAVLCSSSEGNLQTVRYVKIAKLSHTVIFDTKINNLDDIINMVYFTATFSNNLIPMGIGALIQDIQATYSTIVRFILGHVRGNK